MADAPAATPSRWSRWRRGLLYGAFTLAALVLFLVLTFPYDALRARIVTEAAAQGLAVRIGSLRPGLFGVTATRVQVSRPQEPLSTETMTALARGGAALGAAELGEALLLDSVAARPALFPPGVALRAEGLGGVIRGTLGGLSARRVRLELDGLDATQGNLQGFTGLDLEGRINAELDVTIPEAPKTQELDFTQTGGALVLDTRGLVVRGGNITVPMYGKPTPLDLPRIPLGDVKGRVRFEKGLGTLEGFGTKSQELEVRASGTLKLARRLGYSEPALDIKLRADPAFTRQLGILGSGLSILPPDRESPEFRVARLTGFLSRPNFAPGGAPGTGQRPTR